MTFKMVEKILCQKLMTVNRASLLEKVKKRMGVDPICNLETRKESFKSLDSKDLDFNKWLTKNIFQEKLWTQYSEEKPNDKSKILNYLIETFY